MAALFGCVVIAQFHFDFRKGEPGSGVVRAAREMLPKQLRGGGKIGVAQGDGRFHSEQAGGLRIVSTQGGKGNAGPFKVALGHLHGGVIETSVWGIGLQGKTSLKGILSAHPLATQTEQAAGGKVCDGIILILQLRAFIGGNQPGGVPAKDSLLPQLACSLGQLVASLREAGRLGEDPEAEQLPD